MVVKDVVSIGKNTVVRSGSYIVGPVIIGQDCDIGPNCYIRPYTSIGDNCHIGSAVEVKNSIIMKGSKIPHHNYVGDSIIGEECNLGAGTKIANYHRTNYVGARPYYCILTNRNHVLHYHILFHLTQVLRLNSSQ
ncbi:Bifunctional protein GlmU [subsurface metagenome]